MLSHLLLTLVFGNFIVAQSLPPNIEAALTFERSNWANGSIEEDDFYHVPSNSSNLPAGTLLKLETHTNTSAYTIPPQTALSRIIFQTENLNGSLVPASAYILWPYSPRVQPDGTYPVISWAHGTSGAFAECAPSHIRNLWYQFTAPFTLALQDYVVVAPDYAGLGITKKLNGEPIIHQYTANPAAANDLFYAVEAAQSAFSTLSKKFVVMGHSQGGGAAWGAAQRQAKKPVKGYLGTVAASPGTNTLASWQFSKSILGSENFLRGFTWVLAIFLRGVPTVFPNFHIEDALTPVGVQKLRLMEQIQGCNSVAVELFADESTPSIRSDAFDNEYVKAYQNLITAGGKEISGPMLVLQGTGDMAVTPNITTKYVDLTCAKNPRSAIEYITYEGVGHAPTMYTSQRDWLGWIEDRFAGKKQVGGCKKVQRKSALPEVNYQVDLNWVLEYQTRSFQTA
ncbi:MAG: hypothetical protein L6R40_007973 [Gallowayella cf. fulva]|nr:MAG: hypothetical protein L6R40_007973 [Xanthomendoza cf. fulva]